MSFAPSAAPPDIHNTMVGMASHGTDKGLMVRFFVEDVYQEFESQKQGRAVYKPVEMVHIFAPLAKSDIIKRVQYHDEPNAPSHPNRFPRQWAAFKAQQAQVPDGTPLEMCSFIRSHRVKELKAQNIHTAEQLAAVSDALLQDIGMDARRLRELCRAYISEDKGAAQLSEALAHNAAMKADLEAMKAQMAELNLRMANQLHTEGRIDSGTLKAVETSTKRGPGRPRRVENHDHQT